MNKTDTVARKILGWKLNRFDRWYDFEKNQFILTSDFQPEHNLTHAMLLVEKLTEYGISYTEKENFEVCFDDFCATGDTLAEAITNAAYLIADTSSIDDAWF
ncbi:BC1872 family protein [Niallia sp. Krafla_26]|uniref:BC1872 family protein n=1 Tax=Niallia sp. Krafla_26 TaxID=3064703 RepID=UPI003D1625EF